MGSDFYLDTGNLAQPEELQEPIERLWQTLGRNGFLRLAGELTDGKTPTRVVVAEQTQPVRDLQPHRFILKVGRTEWIHDELERYMGLQEVFRTPAVFAELLEPKLTRQALDASFASGALAYQHAADQLAGRTTTSLRDLFAAALLGEEATETVEAVIESTLQALGTLYSQ